MILSFYALYKCIIGEREHYILWKSIFKFITLQKTVLSYTVTDGYFVLLWWQSETPARKQNIARLQWLTTQTVLIILSTGNQCRCTSVVAVFLRPQAKHCFTILASILKLGCSLQIFLLMLRRARGTILMSNSKQKYSIYVTKWVNIVLCLIFRKCMQKNPAIMVAISSRDTRWRCNLSLILFFIHSSTSWHINSLRQLEVFFSW